MVMKILLPVSSMKRYQVINHRIGGLQLPVPMSTSSTSLYPPPSSPSTTTPSIVIITSSSSDSDNHQTHRLSTIYEDTEPSSSLKSEKEETLVESPIKTESVVTSTPPPPPPQQQPEITSSTTLICPTIDTNLANNSHSTSSLLFAATEAATKSALDSPCSPGLLIFPPPRRSSTPIEHSPAYINQSLMINNTNPLEIDKSINHLVSSSSDNLTTTTTITISGDNGTVIKSITKSMPSTELCVANFNRKHLNSKSTTTTSTITSPSSSSSSPSTRPMATIFGQVRNRNTTTTTTSVLMNNNTSETGSTRKSTGKSKHSTMPSTVSNIWSNSTTTSTITTSTTMDTLKDASLKPIGRINASHYDDNSIDRNNNNNSSKKCSDPSKIYTFTGESSPTYNLASCCGDDDDNASSSPLSLTSSPRNTCPFPSSSSSTTTCSDLKHTNVNSSKISRSSKHNHHNSGYRNHDSLKCSISSSTPTPPPPLPPLTQPASSFPLSFPTSYINNKTLQQSYLNMPTLLPSDDMLYLMNKQGCCNVGDNEMTTTTTMIPTSLSTSTPNSFNYLPNSIANNNVGQCNTEAALAAATCLQQLQMQFMCSANPLAMAAALSALSGGGGGAGAGGGFPTNPPFLPPNMNCPPVRFNFNSDMNTNTPCSNSSSTSVGGSGNPANFDWSTSTPFFPNSIDSNLPMVFPNESNFLPPNPSYSTGVNNNSNNNNNSTLGQFHPMDGYGMMLMMNALKPSVVTSLAGGAAAAAVIPGRCDYYPVDNCCVHTVGDTVGLVSESSDLPIDLSAKR
ncbi:unnamed protein product [Trichobilharzia szidati]|nr:unnamed protein product [Trichobilharzia szidati]